MGGIKYSAPNSIKTDEETPKWLQANSIPSLGTMTNASVHKSIWTKMDTNDSSVWLIINGLLKCQSQRQWHTPTGTVLPTLWQLRGTPNHDRQTYHSRLLPDVLSCCSYRNRSTRECMALLLADHHAAYWHLGRAALVDALRCQHDHQYYPATRATSDAS